MRRVPIALALFALLLVLPGLASARGSLLYSVASGDLVVGGVAGAPRVSVPAKAQLQWFTDRPDRRSGVGTAADLVAGWSANRFDRVPPNAALVTTRAGSTMQTIVTLRDPMLRRGRVSFAYTVVSDGEMLAMRTTGRPLMGRYRGELFVDSATTPPCPGDLASAMGAIDCIAAPGSTYSASVPGRRSSGSNSLAILGCTDDGGTGEAYLTTTSGTVPELSTGFPEAVAVQGCPAQSIATALNRVTCRTRGKFTICDTYSVSFTFTVNRALHITSAGLTTGS